MSVYEYTNYKKYLSEWIHKQPKAGRGQLRKMALHLSVSTTLLSQIMNADKHFSLETATEVSEFLGLSEKESEYFILLIEYNRAGSYKLKKLLERKVIREQTIATQISQRLKKDRELSNDEKMQFYSSWLYSAARLMTALPEFPDTKAISLRLGRPNKQISQIIEFLIENGLCRIEKNRLTYGTYSTHVPKDSAFVIKHHQNWRLQGFNIMEQRRDEDLFFTQPMALSKEAAIQIRKMLPGIIEDIHKIAGPSNSEEVRCLNIDWYDWLS